MPDDPDQRGNGSGTGPAGDPAPRRRTDRPDITADPGPPAVDPRVDLRADCARCFGLCCVAPAFAASVDFAVDKPAGVACAHLGAGFACTIHDRLRPAGFRGCAVFDCFGAGQQVSQHTFAGRDWRSDPGSARSMFAVFAVVRTLHELLWYIDEALALPDERAVLPAELRRELREARADTGGLAGAAPTTLLAVDLDAHRRRVHPLLRRVSDIVRADPTSATRTEPARRGDDGRGGRGRADSVPAGRSGRVTHRPRGGNLAGASLVGAEFPGADLRGAAMRGTCLIAANLRGADLRGADLLGADLRDTDLRGADLRGVLFLVQAQLDAAIGDARTALPPTLTRPAHWPSVHASSLPARPGSAATPGPAADVTVGPAGDPGPASQPPAAPAGDAGPDAAVGPSPVSAPRSSTGPARARGSARSPRSPRSPGSPRRRRPR